MSASASVLDAGARVAVYDDLLSSPRIIDIPPTALPDFIERIAAETYEISHSCGGALPFTVIHEIAENFIHAGFRECTVSILDKGNTVRFSDQGPGIAEKELALRPGFTSATQEMKRFIRGVGSGLPIAREYLAVAGGSLVVEDNVGCGTVVTISVAAGFSQGGIPATAPVQAPNHATSLLGGQHPPHTAGIAADYAAAAAAAPNPSAAAAASTQPGNRFAATPAAAAAAAAPATALPAPAWPHDALLHSAAPADPAAAFAQQAAAPMDTPHTQAVNQVLPLPQPLVRLKVREEAALRLLYDEGVLGSGDLVGPLRVSAPTASRIMQCLEDKGMVETTVNRKRILSNAGLAYVQSYC